MGQNGKLLWVERAGSAKTGEKPGRMPMETIAAFIIWCTHQSSFPPTKKFHRTKRSRRKNVKLKTCCTFASNRLKKFITKAIGRTGGSHSKTASQQSFVAITAPAFWKVQVIT